MSSSDIGISGRSIGVHSRSISIRSRSVGIGSARVGRAGGVACIVSARAIGARLGRSRGCANGHADHSTRGCGTCS